MKSDSKIIIYKTFNKSNAGSNKNEMKKCPFCGYEMRQIVGSNVKVCSNRNCTKNQSFFILMK